MQEKISDLLKVMESALEEKMKLMENNIVKRMEEMTKISRCEKLVVSDSASPIDRGKEKAS